MFNKRHVMAIVSAGLTMLGTQAVASDNRPGERCEYLLTASNPERPLSRAEVEIDEEILEIEISDARPNTLYTVWIDFRNRARLAETGNSIEALSEDYKPLLDEGALPRGVAPAIASTAGVTAGMGLDLNGIITDDDGDGKLKAQLDYNLLEPGDSPVVGRELAMQGKNRVGGYWLRKYPVDPDVEASLQIVDPLTGLPDLHRATAQGITIVGHPDFITHGHTPGVGGVDHFPGFKGDFPEDCLPLP
ncbi:MAG: hypothetical protein ACE5I0_08975 [Candidatus Binatia bacterium]